MMRDHFPIFQRHPHWIYLDSAATSQKPQAVIDALTSFYLQDYATVHRSIYHQSAKATELYNASREAARQFLNAAHFEEIVFTKGTTDALNLLAMSLGRLLLQPGDEILISEIEHHSNIVPWQMIAQTTGATLRYIPINPQGELLWQTEISSSTKIISVAHMSNVTGTIHPIAEIAREARRHGALLIVDGAQGAPHLPIDVQALDCDFYAFSAHKCYGPTGIGILFGKKEWLTKMPPIQGGGDMIARVDLQQTSFAEPPLRFEAGTPPIASAIAFKKALELMTLWGQESIASHEEALMRSATEQLSTIDGLRILGTSPNKGPLITFTIDQIHPLDLATFLDAKGIAIRSGHMCAQPALRAFGLEAACRASFAVYNTSEEVDRFVDALRRSVGILRPVKKKVEDVVSLNGST